MTAADHPSATVIFLVGFMGVGKSTLAPRLASIWGWPFLDTDLEIERRAGRSIDTIFATESEGRFRSLEQEVLERSSGVGPLVVATGGGLFLAAGPRRWMKRHGFTVWLDVPLETCRSRIGRGAGRPLARHEDPVDFRAFFERRRACYGLAELRIEVPPVGAEEAARHVAERLGAVLPPGRTAKP